MNLAKKETQKYYVINVRGDKPTPVEIGRLNPDTGVPTGPTETTYMQIGSIAIPNYSEVWGRLLVDKQNKPTGEIEFLEWGDSKGTLLRLRCLKSAASLHIDYQDNVLKLKPRDEDGEIELRLGTNEFRYSDQALLIQLLKVHYMNESSKSRNPNGKTVVFEDYSGDARLANRNKIIEERQIAERIILDRAGEVDGYSVLAGIFGIDPLMDDAFIQEELLDKLAGKEGVDAFMTIVQRAQQKTMNVLLEAIEMKVLSGAEGEPVTVLDTNSFKHVPLFADDVLQDEPDTVKFIMSKFFEAKTGDALQVIENALTKEKLAVLN